MHSDLVELGWTEEQWNRIAGAVTEEAQKARVAAQMLPLVGPEDPTTIAVPQFRLETSAKPHRLAVSSRPTLFLTTIAVNLYLRSHEMADPSLQAALGMFRRAANYVARIEDSLVFRGRPVNDFPEGVPTDIKNVATVTGDGGEDLEGLISKPADKVPETITKGGGAPGDDVINAIVAAIGKLDSDGRQGPYAAALSQNLFEEICRPNVGSLILPRDRILPFLQGPLLRASALPKDHGVVVSLSGSPLELVVAADLCVRYLQTTLEPRYVFRVCERVALRIREPKAICILSR
jgi:uncharacterized linocin/CFP29 family protein